MPKREIYCSSCRLSKETDPTGKAAHDPGAKLDENKVMAGLLSDFSLALLEVAKVCTYGAKKYSVRGWEKVDNWEERYNNAFWRHLLAREKLDGESGLTHESHMLWNLLALIELKLRKK